MATPQWPSKDPDEVLDFQIDWSARLSADTINTSSWPNPPLGITIMSMSNTATNAILWLSGGTNGQRYLFTNKVVTLGGRTLEQNVTLDVIEQ